MEEVTGHIKPSISGAKTRPKTGRAVLLLGSCDSPGIDKKLPLVVGGAGGGGVTVTARAASSSFSGLQDAYRGSNQGTGMSGRVLERKGKGMGGQEMRA